MGKSFNTGNLTNIIGYSGSNVAITGSVNISGTVVSTGTSLVSGSGQISYTGITNIPSGIVSGSAQLPSGIVSSSTQVTNYGFATTGSNTFQGTQTLNGSLVVTGSLTAQQFIVSSSVTYLTESFASGSHKFGDSSDDTHQFTGSIFLNGSIVTTATGSIGTYVTPTSGGTILTAVGSGSATSAQVFTTTNHASFFEANTNSGSIVSRLQSQNASFVGTLTNNTFDIVAGGNVIIRTTGSGLVGVNKSTTPNATLDVNGNTIVSGSLITTSNVGIGISDLGPDGLSLPATFNYSWSEGSGNAYAVLFRQRNSAATVIASGYKRSGTGTFASSYGISMARAAIAVGYNNGSIAFFSDTASNVANGTDITPTERMTLNSSGNLTVTGTINGLSIPNDLFAQQFLLMGA